MLSRQTHEAALTSDNVEHGELQRKDLNVSSSWCKPAWDLLAVKGKLTTPLDWVIIHIAQRHVCACVCACVRACARARARVSVCQFA